MTDEIENWLKLLRDEAVADADRIDRLTAAAARCLAARQNIHLEQDEFTRKRMRANVISAVRSENYAWYRQHRRHIGFPSLAAAAALILGVVVVFVAMDNRSGRDDIDDPSGIKEYVGQAVKQVAISADRWPRFRDWLLAELNRLAISHELEADGVSVQFKASDRLIQELGSLSVELPAKLQEGVTYRFFVEGIGNRKQIDPDKESKQ